MKLKEIGAKNDMLRGWKSQSIINKKIYSMWYHMLSRCYCTDICDRNYKYYKDCTVHPDFLLLSNFVKWIEQEPNYLLLVADPGCYKWTIDKDGLIPGNKEYAPGKIRLVTNSENKKEELSRNGCLFKSNHPMKNKDIARKIAIYRSKAVIGVSVKYKYICYFKSIKDTKLNGITNVSKCLSGKRKTSKGYKWFYATDLIGVMNYLYKGGGAHGAS